MKRDILKELSDGSVSPAEAERIYDAIMDAGKIDYAVALGLNNLESTAFGYGVPLHELSKWRKDGWPKNCAVCKRPLDVSKGGWMATHVDASGHHMIIHIPCMPSNLPSRD